MALYESWDQIATQLGFKDEKEMLVELYVVQQFSISQLIKKLGYAQNSIRARLLEYGVTLRARGGANSKGHSKLKDISDAELMKLKPSDAFRFDCIPNTIYKEKVRRKLITPKESQPCTTPVSPQPPTSINTPAGDTSNSVSPKLPCETQPISPGTPAEEASEILSSLITELTKES